MPVFTFFSFSFLNPKNKNATKDTKHRIFHALNASVHFFSVALFLGLASDTLS